MNCFFDEAWVKSDKDGSVKIGAILQHQESSKTRSLILPRIGEIVSQGLPLVAICGENGSSPKIIPAPVSGKVVEVNEPLAKNPAGIWKEPFGKAWMVRVEPSQLEENLKACRKRNILLASSDSVNVKAYVQQFENLGCNTKQVIDATQLLEELKGGEYPVVMLDSASFAQEGPALTQKINEAAPNAKVIVTAESGSELESAYRSNKIFYYCVKPINKDEISDILISAFQVTVEPSIPDESGSSFLPNIISKVSVTNRHGSKVALLAFGELLRNNTGLGRQVIGKLLNLSFPLELRRGKNPHEAGDSMAIGEITQEAIKTDRIYVLTTKDSQSIPGTVKLEPFEGLPGGNGKDQKVQSIVVQPLAGSEPLNFDVRTTEGLSEFILQKMTSE